MKKIIFVGEYMLCGGVEKSLLALLKFIDPKKYSITVMLLKKRGVLLPELPDYVKIVEMPLPKNEEFDILYGKGNALKYYLKKGRIFLFIKKLIRGFLLQLFSKSPEEKRINYYKMIDHKFPIYEEDYDIAVDYMGYGLINTFYVAKKIKAKKKLTWIHFEPQQAMKNFSTFNYYLKDYDKIICVSKEIYRQMKICSKEISNKLEVFYNILDVERIQNQAKEKIVLDQDYEGIKILSIGRLDKPKGFDIAIPIIKRLVDKNYKVKWYIIGEGYMRNELESLIEQYDLNKYIVLLGQKTNPYPYLLNCDIYFQPSRHEGYGIAVAEARVFCKPIIVTDFAGAKEQLINGQTAIITKCTEDELYIALKKLINNPSLQKYFSQKLLEQKKNYKRQVEYLEEIFNKV